MKTAQGLTRPDLDRLYAASETIAAYHQQIKAAIAESYKEIGRFAPGQLAEDALRDVAAAIDMLLGEPMSG